MNCLLCMKGQPTTGYACTPCYDRLDAALWDIEQETITLSAVPSLAQRNGTRGGTLASHRSPARLDVLVLTDTRTTADSDGTLGVLGVLGSWARAVREDRQLAWPERVTVLSERRLLTAHLSYVVAQPWVDDFAREIHGLHRQLRRANGTTGDAPVARCGMPTPDGVCHGNVWRRNTWSTVWRVLPDRCQRDQVEAPDGPAQCDTCGNHWDDAHQMHLLELAAKLEAAKRAREQQRPTTDDGRPMHTVTEIAAQLGVTENAAYIRLSRAKIRAVRGHYDAASLLERASA